MDWGPFFSCSLSVRMNFNARAIERDGFDLDAARFFGSEDDEQQLDAGLDEALGPSRLLRLEGRHLDREFGGAFNFREIFEFPTGHL